MNIDKQCAQDFADVLMGLRNESDKTSADKVKALVQSYCGEGVYLWAKNGLDSDEFVTNKELESLAVSVLCREAFQHLEETYFTLVKNGTKEDWEEAQVAVALALHSVKPAITKEELEGYVPTLSKERQERIRLYVDSLTKQEEARQERIERNSRGWREDTVETTEDR